MSNLLYKGFVQAFIDHETDDEEAVLNLNYSELDFTETLKNRIHFVCACFAECLLRENIEIPTSKTEVLGYDLYLAINNMSQWNSDFWGKEKSEQLTNITDTFIPCHAYINSSNNVDLLFRKEGSVG